MDRAVISAIFSEYNRARRALDPKRVNRALSLIQSGEIWAKQVEYGTTIRDCYCPDRVNRGQICKHMIALMILERTHKPKKRTCYHAYNRLAFSKTEENKILRVCNDCGTILEEIWIS